MTTPAPAAESRFRRLKMVAIIIGAILAAPILIVLMFARMSQGNGR